MHSSKNHSNSEFAKTSLRLHSECDRGFKKPTLQVSGELDR